MNKKLGFGFMRLPVTVPGDETAVDMELTKQMVDLYMSRGFNYFDTARRYCGEMSEPALRECLCSRYPRESYELTDKITIFHGYIKKPEDQEPFFKKQLETCGVEYFDNYLIHSLNVFFYEDAKRLGTFDFIQRMKEQGFCRRTGFSFHDSPELLDTILQEHPEVDLVQLQINYLDWEDGGIRAKECYETARRHGKQVLVMEPIKGGNLADLPEEAEKLLKDCHPDWSTASWAIRFVASLDGVYRVLSGMNTLEQVEDNTTYMQNFQPLTAEEQALLQKAAEIIRAQTAIPCTGCGYCAPECPKNIAIPNYFALYNGEKRHGSANYVRSYGLYYNNLAQVRGKASDCIKCGRCEKACPQHLAIRDFLQDVAAAFESGPEHL